MPDQSSVFRTALILLVAVVLIVAAFSFLRVPYPTGGPTGTSGGGQLQLFQYQFQDINGIGLNVTKFSPQEQKSVLVEGYVYNSSSQLPIGDMKLYVAMYPVETATVLDSTGYYFYYLRYTGTGTFSYKVGGYESQTVGITATASVDWVNVSLPPSTKYPVTGYASDVYGSHVAGISINFSNFYQTFHVVSNSTGAFSLRLYDAAYNLSAEGGEYLPTETALDVNGTGISNLAVTVSPSIPSPFEITGFVNETGGLPVPGVRISTYPVLVSTSTNASGFFTIGGMYGSINVTLYTPGYSSRSPLHLYVSLNMADVNFTLTPVSSLGYGLVLYNLIPGSQTGDPEVNASTVLSHTNLTSLTGPSGNRTVRISTFFEASGSALVDTSFIAFIGWHGFIYRGFFSTNASASAALTLNFSGNYGICFLSLGEGYYATSGNFTGPASLVASMAASRLHNVSVAYSSYYGNFTVPDSGFSFTNSLFNISTSRLVAGNTTYLNFTVPDGHYVLGYSNSGYIGSYVTVNVTGSGTSVHVRLYPYLVQLINNVNITWNVSMTPGNASGVIVPANGSVLLHAYISSFMVKAASLQGNYSVSTTFQLSAITPMVYLYLNESRSSATYQLLSCSTNNSTGSMNATFLLDIPGAGGILVDRLLLQSINFTVLNSSVVLNGVRYAFAGNSINFSAGTAIPSGNSTLVFNSSQLSGWELSELCQSLTIRMDYTSVLLAVRGGSYG